MILEISTSCSSSTMYNILSILKGINNIILLIAPILLIVSLIKLFTSGVLNSDDKQLLKKIRNSIIALIIIFLIPVIVNVVMRMFDDTYSVTDCWNNATDKISTTDSYYTLDDSDKKPISDSADKYDTGSSTSDNNNNYNNSGYVDNSKSNAFNDVMNCAKTNANNSTGYKVINNKCYDVNGKGSCQMGWCVRFVWYCFYTTGHKNLYYNGKYTGNPGKLANWGKSSGLVVNNKSGQAGDIFDLYSQTKGRYSHGGFIEKRNSDGSYGTIERCGDKVCRKTRKNITLIIRPKY